MRFSPSVVLLPLSPRREALLPAASRPANLAWRPSEVKDLAEKRLNTLDRFPRLPVVASFPLRPMPGTASRKRHPTASANSPHSKPDC